MFNDVKEIALEEAIEQYNKGLALYNEYDNMLKEIPIRKEVIDIYQSL